MSLKSIIERTDTRAGRYFDLSIQVLIIFSLVTFSIETLPDLSPTVQQWLHYCEIIVVAIFTVEYVLRILVADKKRNYLFSFHGIIDFIAIAPFYLSLGIDLRSLRILRMLRVFRLLKLAKYNQAMARLTRAIYLAKEEIGIFGLVTVMLLYLAAVGIYFFENPAQPEAFSSIFDAMWWAIVTLTTVGYGDIYPITTGGRMFTFVILMIGLGIVAVPAGLLASSLSKVRMEEDEEAELAGKNTQESEPPEPPRGPSL